MGDDACDGSLIQSGIKDVNQTTGKNEILTDVVGSISKAIGTGKHAQVAVSFKVIQYCFLCSSVVSLYLLINFSFKGDPQILDSIKTVWGIFMPVVTLAMGYLFGKGKD